MQMDSFPIVLSSARQMTFATTSVCPQQVARIVISGRMGRGMYDRFSSPKMMDEVPPNIRRVAADLRCWAVAPDRLPLCGLRHPEAGLCFRPRSCQRGQMPSGLTYLLSK